MSPAVYISVCIYVFLGCHDVVFILDLIPETTGPSVVFPFIHPSFPPSSSSLPHWFSDSSQFQAFLRGVRTFAPSHSGLFRLSSSFTVCLSCLSLSLQPMRKEPEVVTVTLKKHNGMGLSIVAAKVGNNTWSLCFWF